MALPSTVGRSVELERLRNHLSNGAPLVTITGPPGIGKTHLARLVAAEVGEEALFCETMQASDADSLCLVIARALKVSLGRDTSLDARAAMLGRALKRYRLVILDNLEQVIADAAPLVRQWIMEGVCFIVTSRNALLLRDEQLLELAPLGKDDAVRLFDARVRRLRPDFDLKAVRQSVESIVSELDHVPLALELAAGRSRVLDPPALLERLRDRFAVLRSRERFGQWSTLEQAIDWSWQLLSDEEQLAAAECTVFRGAFDVVAAEQVLSADSSLELIDALRDKSMLIATETHPMRLSMLASIRAFCGTKLTAEQRHGAYLRHATYFAQLARNLSPGADAGHLPTVQSLAAHQDELLAVVVRLQSANDYQELVAACVIASAALVETQGVPSWLEPAFDTAIDRLSDERNGWSAQLYLERSTLRRLRGALDMSREDAERALELCDPRSKLGGKIHRRIGMLDVDSGRLEDAVQRLEQACEIYAASEDRRSLGIAKSSLARALYAAGAHERAENLCNESLRLHTAAGLTVWEGLTHGYLAYICMDAERYSDAESHLERSVELFRSLGSDSYEGAFVGLLGTLRHLQGQLREALESFSRARSAMVRSGRRRLAAIHYGNEGIVRLELGQLRRSDELLANAIHELDAVGDATSAQLFKAHLAGSAIAAGRLDHARAILASNDAAEGGTKIVWELQNAKLKLASDAQSSAAFRNAARSLAKTIAALESDSRGDVRIAVREIARFLEEKTSARIEVRIASDGSWFEVDSERHDLRSREVLSRMLLALANARLAGDDGVSGADLIAATWPGDRMTEASAASRLHSTVRRLRKMGLSEVLLYEHGKYRLNEEAFVHWDR
ncbi:MAG: AAA family ATPase [Myxococcota bacterium]